MFHTFGEYVVRGPVVPTAPQLTYGLPGNKKRERNLGELPMNMAGSVVGIAFDKGVLIGADNLVTYGRMKRFYDVVRVFKLNDSTVYGFCGDYAGLQSLQRLINAKVDEDRFFDKVSQFTPASFYSWLRRVFYNRQSIGSCTFIEIVIGGMEKGVPFLGQVNIEGYAYEDMALATGIGQCIALPLLHKSLEERDSPPTLKAANKLMSKSIEILYYRDTGSTNTFTTVMCTDKGVKFRGPLKVAENWQTAKLCSGY